MRAIDEIMLRGLWQLTWLEIKIFLREPLGVIGTVGFPVLIYYVLSRVAHASGPAPELPRIISIDLPILAAILISASAVMSLVAIIAIYREGGILKRLRATPLRPYTILTAHVLVKLVFTALTLGAMILAGRRYHLLDPQVPVASFTLALLFSTVTVLSVGFIIASLVPTARFAQPIATVILYPMLGLSGLFMPIEDLPPALQTVALVSPLTYAVSLLRGIWLGQPWSAHAVEVVMLLAMFVACIAVSAKVFRWE